MRRLLGSVRARTALGATLVVALALVAAGAALLLVLRGTLVEQAGLQANVAARSVASQLASGTPYDRLDLPDDTEEHPVQVVDADGRVVALGRGVERIAGTASPGVRVLPPGAADRAGGAGTVAEAAAYSSGDVTVDGDTATYRFAAVRATTPGGDPLTVYAGAALTGEKATVSGVTEAMLAAFPVLLAVVAGVTWLVTRRALRPVEGIRREMAAITASEDLSRRVPVPLSRDEIAGLARTTNETLAALEASVERQRRFVADASHELRSPIASLRTQLEVGAAHPELLDVEGAVQDTVRLQRLAADLLLLARLDAGERPGRARVDLGRLLEQEAERRGGDRVPLRVVAAPGVEVLGSRGQLTRVLANLLDNAQRHAETGVAAEVAAGSGGAVLTVTDDGAGVPEGERERVFERFVRLDDARTRDEGGAGLGLAIARDIARRHGGDLTTTPAHPQGACFELRLPEAD
ncbi:HAMP domain-containing sensor histidine kinase [Streptomyces sp. NPDC001941]|uniref:sensor histidine kinase n=1 Tax=Streptomyces sp. NPDC001941 TaxID=3154659 RepID=UPI00331A5B5D